MKVISLLQPWASLIVLNHKQIETRSWNTKYRGEILIHASAGKKPLYRGITMDFHQEFNLQIQQYKDLPFGAIIGKVNLISTISTDITKEKNVLGINHESGRMWKFTHQELDFGDYSPGRYGWLLANPVAFPVPTPAKGKLGIWEFDESLLIK